MILCLDKKSKEALSENFGADEFRCGCRNKDCESTYIDESLIDALEELRAYVKRPILIESGYRCQKHNVKVGGAPRSYHLLGRAADISIPNLTGLVIKEYAELVPAFENGGIGVHSYTCHLDNREEKWRG